MDNTPDNGSHDALRGFATQVLGSISTVEDRSRTFGRKSITWRVVTADGDAFYLKQHEERRLYHTELIVYSKWLPALRGAGDWQLPELADNSDELGALVLTEVPGDVLSESEPTPEDRLTMHWTAGRLAATIHRLDVDAEDAGPARTYDRSTWDQYLTAAAPHLDRELLQWIERTASGDDLFRGLQLVPTHSDFSPRNWLIDRSSDRLTLGVIDWERARPGYWLEDAVRMAFDDWAEEPALRMAFFDGYGRMPSSAEEHQLDLICLANAVATVSWATRQGDLEFAHFGREVITELRGRLS